MSEGITGSRSFGSVHYAGHRDTRVAQADPFEGQQFRPLNPYQPVAAQYTHRSDFTPYELMRLRELGIDVAGRSVFLRQGEEGAVQFLQVARILTNHASNRAQVLRNPPHNADEAFLSRLAEIQQEQLLADTVEAVYGLAASSATLAGAATNYNPRHVPLESGPAPRAGGNRPGGQSGNTRHGGGGSARPPRTPGGGGGGGVPSRTPGGRASNVAVQERPQTQTMPAGNPANNAVPFHRGQAQATTSQQPTQSALQQRPPSPTEAAAGLLLNPNSTQGRRLTENQPLGLDRLGNSIADGAFQRGAGGAGGTYGRSAGAGLGAAAREQLNSGGAGTGAGTREQTGESYSGGLGIELDPTFMERQRAEQEQWRARVAQQRAEADAAQQARLQAALARNEAANQLSAQMREENEHLQAKRPEREDDFVVARRVVDALPELLGPEAFAKYEEIMSDPIWRSALEREAHREPFLDFVQSIIAGNIHPRVAITRLRNDDPDTVGGPPLTGLSRGREWDIPDVERLLRPNEQDAFRRYAEANPDVVEIVVEAGYDASAADMVIAIRALLNGAYGQDVAAWLRAGGLAGGRVPPGGNTPYTGTGAEFPEPERQPETQRIIVPGAPNTEALPPGYRYAPDDPDNLIIVPDEVSGPPRIDTTTPLHTLTPAELLRNARLSRAAGEAPRDQIQEALGPGTTVIIRRARDFGNYQGPCQDGHVHDGCTINTTEGLRILGLDPEEFADLPGIGAGTYDTSWNANLPQDNVFETVQRYNQRVHAYYQQMGGFSNSFAVRPIIDAPQTYVDPQTGDELPDYYVARVGAQNLIGLLRFDWERGVAYVDEFIKDRYGVPTIMPIEMPIEIAEEILGHPIPRDTEYIEYYQAPVGCELHYGTVDDNRAMIFNTLLMMMFYDEQYPNDRIFDYKVLGTMSGVPYQPEASNAIFETSHAINQISDKLGVPRDRLLVNQGETNLSKENIHTASGSLHIADWTPEVWAHVNEYMDSLAGTGQVITIHCDLRQAVDVEPGAVFNQWPPSLATFFTESQVSNREHIVRLANDHPNGIFVHAHTGLNVTGPVRPDHADDLRWMLENAVHNNLYFDMSWAAVYMSYAEFAEKYGELIKDYPDRFIWGSDNLPQFATDGESPTIGVLEEFFNTGVTEHLSQEEMERLFAQNYEDVFIAGGRRHGQWRSDPANAEWLATREPGDFTPPKIWTRDADGEFHFIENPAYQAVE